MQASGKRPTGAGSRPTHIAVQLTVCLAPAASWIVHSSNRVVLGVTTRDMSCEAAGGRPTGADASGQLEEAPDGRAIQPRDSGEGPLGPAQSDGRGEDRLVQS